MIICQLCGYENDDGDQFCGNCPGHLAHVGQQVDEPAPAVAYEEEEPAQDPRTGLVSRMKAAVAGRLSDEAPAEVSTVVGAPTAEASPPGRSQPSKRRRSRPILPQRSAPYPTSTSRPRSARIAMLGALGPWRAPVMDWGRGTYQSLRQRVAPELVTVNPVGIIPASGSSAHPEHPAENAILQEDNTHWTAGAEGPGQVLVVTFAEPVDLRSVGFRSGASGDAFLRHPRPFRRPPRVRQPEQRRSRADRHQGVPRPSRGRQQRSRGRDPYPHLHPAREGESNAVAITNVQFTALKESVGAEE